MKKILSVFYFSLIVFASIFFVLPNKICSAKETTQPVAGSAASTTTTTPTAPGKTEVGVGFTDDTIKSGSSYTYSEYIAAIYSFAMKAAVALCILMIVYAGFKYITSKGDSGGINEAKDIIFSTLTGAALLMLIYLVQNIAGMPTPAP